MASPVSVCYFSHPPFTDLVDGRVDGVFWELAKESVEQCLEGNVTFNHDRFRNEDDLLRSGLRRCNISFPVTESPLYARMTDGAFIPIVSTPGAVWLDPTAGPHQTSMAQLKVVGQAWPLLLIIIISCSFAAVLVWFMERLKNPQEFPRPFVRGFWEGWWWAFITMTTVGYGDRSPKTICGRLFAMAWISFGLVLISMFTAGVTTALSQGAQPEEDSRFFQNNITVINGSFEHILVYELGSSPILISDWKSLVEPNSTDDEESEAPHHGALIEHYMYLHLKQEHGGRMKRVKPQYVLKRPSLRGFYSNLQADINSCMATVMLTRQIGVYSKIVQHQHGSEQETPDARGAEEVAQLLFSTSNAVLGIVAATFVVIFIALLAWEKIYWQPRNPDYKFVEHNWKYDRQKKEAEFGRQLDLKSYYRHSRRSRGGGGHWGGSTAATTPTSGMPATAMSRPITIETLHDVVMLEESEAEVAAAAAAATAAVIPTTDGVVKGDGNNGGLARPKRLWCQVDRRIDDDEDNVNKEDEESTATSAMNPMSTV